MMGRWSRQLAPLFVEFARVRDGEKVLDVGCGTGSLSATLARVSKVSKIVGIDPAKGFVEFARTQIADPRVTFDVGDAQNLPYLSRDASPPELGCSNLDSVRGVPSSVTLLTTAEGKGP